MDSFQSNVNETVALVDKPRESNGHAGHPSCEAGTLRLESLYLLGPEVCDRNINWVIGSLPAVEADEVLPGIVMRNLLSNAIKYTRGRETANIQIGSLESDSSEAEIFIRDNGAGFDMTYAGRLFGVFQR